MVQVYDHLPGSLDLAILGSWHCLSSARHAHLRYDICSVPLLFNFIWKLSSDSGCQCLFRVA